MNTQALIECREDAGRQRQWTAWQWMIVAQAAINDLPGCGFPQTEEARCVYRELIVQAHEN
ncbi:hypothetical protein [Candidatus Nitrotoga sp. AM1P]|uniref:hypothetical protein n=1 Tax=Candidatus Nitrotoga sp. AM1P TaxID=2559597 RepID=UPI001566FBE5|nr:hypothetical protein [Candidatus Nitrotoga sp. AM1P]